MSCSSTPQEEGALRTPWLKMLSGIFGIATREPEHVLLVVSAAIVFAMSLIYVSEPRQLFHSHIFLLAAAMAVTMAAVDAHGIYGVKRYCRLATMAAVLVACVYMASYTANPALQIMVTSGSAAWEFIQWLSLMGHYDPLSLFFLLFGLVVALDFTTRCLGNIFHREHYYD